MFFKNSFSSLETYRIALAGRNRILNWNPNLDPIGTPERQIYNQVFDYLVYKESNELFSEGIAKYNFCSSSKRLSFSIQNQLFHDFTRITATDILYCMKKSAVKLKNINEHLFNILFYRIEIIDQFNLVLNNVEPEFLNKILSVLSSPAFGIFKTGFCQNNIPKTNIIGSGPYVVNQIEKEFIRLTPFIHYPRKIGVIQNLVFTIVDKLEYQKNNDLDEIYSFGGLNSAPPEMLAVRSSQFSLGTLLFNTQSGLFSNKPARKAFFNSLSNCILSGYYDKSWLPPSGYFPPNEIDEKFNNLSPILSNILDIEYHTTTCIRIGVTNERQEARLRTILNSKYMATYSFEFIYFNDLNQMKLDVYNKTRKIDIAFLAIRKDFGLAEEFVEFLNPTSPLAIFPTQFEVKKNYDDIAKMHSEYISFPIGYYQETRWVKPNNYLTIGKDINTGPPRYILLTPSDWHKKIEDLKFNHELATKVKTEADNTSKLSNLITRVVHDIKSPLSAIKFISANSELKQEDHQILDLAINRIDSILKALANPTHFICNKVIKSETINLESIIRNAYKEISSQTKKGLTLKIKSLNNAPLNKNLQLPFCDLQSIITNIFKNAWESNNKDQVHIQVIISNLMPLEIVISDNGPGFESNIFDKLGNQQITTKPEGSGLGLLQTKNILKEIGGTIVLSNSHSGASIKLVIPTLQLN